MSDKKISLKNNNAATYNPPDSLVKDIRWKSGYVYFIFKIGYNPCYIWPIDGYHGKWCTTGSIL